MWRRRSRRQEEEISITVIERGQPGIKLHRPAVARHIHHVHHTRWRPPSHGVLIPVPMGLHSFTSQLNVSASCGIWGARRGCVARSKGVLGGG